MAGVSLALVAVAVVGIGMLAVLSCLVINLCCCTQRAPRRKEREWYRGRTTRGADGGEGAEDYQKNLRRAVGLRPIAVHWLAAQRDGDDLGTPGAYTPLTVMRSMGSRLMASARRLSSFSRSMTAGRRSTDEQGPAAASRSGAATPQSTHPLERRLGRASSGNDAAKPLAAETTIPPMAPRRPPGPSRFSAAVDNGTPSRGPSASGSPGPSKLHAAGPAADAAGATLSPGSIDGLLNPVLNTDGSEVSVTVAPPLLQPLAREPAPTLQLSDAPASGTADLEMQGSGLLPPLTGMLSVLAGGEQGLTEESWAQHKTRPSAEPRSAA